MSKRVLFFGVTGIDKQAVLRSLADHARTRYARKTVSCLDFEGEYLFNRDNGGVDWYQFLNYSYDQQREAWMSSWRRFDEEKLCVLDGDVYIAMHGCFVRGYYGSRWILDPRLVAEAIRPDLIVILLDDVYDMWWRTEHRAQGEAYRGRPTLEQLLFARRSELMVADQVAHVPGQPIHQLMISVSHPCETVARSIYGPSPKTVYLAFPISAPRRLQGKGDPSGLRDVAAFLTAAYRQQRDASDLVVTCPLGIDELPLVTALRDESCKTTATEGREDVEAVRFDRRRWRWDLDAVWPQDERLCKNAPSGELQVPIPREQVSNAAGIIETDVGWRDYRLVDQADFLIAFNPVFRGAERISRSVFQEINHFASTKGRPAFVVQEKAHDPGDVLARHFPVAGTMQEGPGPQLVIRKQDVNEAFAAVLR